MVTRSGLAIAFSNLALAAFNLVFAYVHVRSFVAHPRASVVLIVVLELLLAVLSLVRAPAQRAWNTPWTWLTTMGGCFLPLLLRPGDATSDVTWAQILQLAGTSAAIYGALSLNRSFGIVPALRDGIKSRGAYRWVRHPLYATYTVAHVGYLASNFTTRNFVIVVATFAFQLARIANEERVLTHDPEYARYKARTRWRIIPLVY